MEAVIVDCLRTAEGKAPRGTLRNTPPDEMAAVARRLIEKYPQVAPGDVEDVILGCAMPEAGLDIVKTNVNGGAIALGHPLGCTGAKRTASILREMRRRQAKYGLVTMRVGGGQGAAGVFERL